MPDPIRRFPYPATYTEDIEAALRRATKAARRAHLRNLLSSILAQGIAWAVIGWAGMALWNGVIAATIVAAPQLSYGAALGALFLIRLIGWAFLGLRTGA